jgi:predicted phosphodiesterase
VNLKRRFFKSREKQMLELKNDWLIIGHTDEPMYERLKHLFNPTKLRYTTSCGFVMLPKHTLLLN